MKYLILFITIAFYLPLYGQTYSSIISDKQIYDFINYWEADRNPEGEKTVSVQIEKWDIASVDSNNNYCSLKNINHLLFQNVSTFEGHNIDSLFSQEDKQYIIKQVEAIKDTIWHTPFRNTVFKKGDTITTENKLRQSTPKTYYYTIPLFSKNNELVIFYDFYYCGPLCAQGICAIYKYKGNGKWEILGITGMLIS